MQQACNSSLEKARAHAIIRPDFLERWVGRLWSNQIVSRDNRQTDRPRMQEPAPGILYMAYCCVAWEVEFTDEFQDWWNTISEEQQDEGALRTASHRICRRLFPISSKVSSSLSADARTAATRVAAGRCGRCRP